MIVSVFGNNDFEPIAMVGAVLFKLPKGTIVQYCADRDGYFVRQVIKHIYRFQLQAKPVLFDWELLGLLAGTAGERYMLHHSNHAYIFGASRKFRRLERYCMQKNVPVQVIKGHLVSQVH